MDHNGHWFPCPRGATQNLSFSTCCKSQTLFQPKSLLPMPTSTYCIQMRLPSAKPSGKQHGMAAAGICHLWCGAWQRCSSYKHLQFSSHPLFIVPHQEEHWLFALMPILHTTKAGSQSYHRHKTWICLGQKLIWSQQSKSHLHPLRAVLCALLPSTPIVPSSPESDLVYSYLLSSNGEGQCQCSAHPPPNPQGNVYSSHQQQDWHSTQVQFAGPRGRTTRPGDVYSFWFWECLQDPQGRQEKNRKSSYCVFKVISEKMWGSHVWSILKI